MILKLILLTLGGFILGSSCGFLVDQTIGSQGWGIVAECGGATILGFALIYFSLPWWVKRRQK